MNRWLLKSEPDVFGIDDLKRKKVEPWNGVRNYQARNYLRAMKLGDEVLFYHSSCPLPGVAGIARVASAPYPDPSQFDPNSHYFDPKSDPDDPRWWLVDVRFVQKLKRVIPLAEIKALDGLGDFALTGKRSRLSVMPVTKAQWDAIVALAEPDAPA